VSSAQIETEQADLRKTVSYCEVSVFLPVDIELDSGEKLSKPELAVRIYGDLTQPAVVAAGGVSAGRIIADTAEDRGVDELHAFAGASYGGMVGLCFAQVFPERIKKLITISAPDRPNPAATAQRGVQRRIIEFAKQCGRPEEGVSLARQLAMVSYRTPEEFGERFDSAAKGKTAGDPYDICEYLIARGQAYDVAPERYLTLSDSVDRHRADPEKIKADTLVIAAASDRLSPPADLKRLADAIPAARFVEIASVYGHDAFLKEPGVIGPHIKDFLKGA
jgi:homoserine O-acetyltransferase